MDACLATMAVGIAVLFASIAANLAGAVSSTLHVLVLVASNVAMAAFFAARARRLGMRVGVALALWLVALDGTFLLLLGWMAR